MKRLLGALSALALFVGMTVAGAAPAGAWGINVVRQGQSIQAAIDKAKSGDTIFVLPGTYAEHLTIVKDGINLVGLHATLVPPAGEAPPGPCSFGGPTEDGICVAGDFASDPNTGATTVNRYVVGTKIAGFTIRGFEGTGIDQIGGRRSTFVGNNAKDNSEYGFAAFSSTGTTVAFNRASGSEEAGIYIGDSPQADATLVGNTTTNNLFGFFVRNAEHGTIVGNVAQDNCVGALFLADAPGPMGAFDVAGNLIRHNNKACPPTEEGPPASGVGVLILGAHDVSLKFNAILDNNPTGPSFAAGGVVLQTGFAGTPPVNNRVRGNLIAHNSTDISWDGTGTGNLLEPNLCQTSDPAGICGG